MPAPNKHKQKASREWQKKHGQVQPKMSKKQKEKENLKKLDSNWDRYELHSDDEEIGRSLEEMMASAAPPSSFPSLIQNSFVPSIDTNLSLLDFEKSMMDLDYFKLLKLTYDEVPNEDILRELNHKRQIKTEDLFHDPLRDRLLNTEPRSVSQPESATLSESSSSPVSPVAAVTPVEDDKATEPETKSTVADAVQVKAKEPDSDSDLEDWLDSVI